MAKKAEPKSVTKSSKSGANTNGRKANGSANNETVQKLNPEILEKITAIRSKVNETFGKVVIANFKQVVKEGDLRIHLLITRLVDAEVLKKMGAKPVESG